MSPAHNDAPASRNVVAEGPGLGAMLRQAREQRGLTAKELGQRLNLPADTIEALEREALDALPGPVYVRGYLRRLAKELGLDEAQLLRAHERIAGEAAPVLPRPQAPVETMHTPRRKRSLGLALLILAIFALVAAGFLTQRQLPEAWLDGENAALPQGPAPLPGPAAESSPMASIPLPPPADAPAAPQLMPPPAAGSGQDLEAEAPPATAMPGDEGDGIPAEQPPAEPPLKEDSTEEPPAAQAASTSSSSATESVLELRIGRADSWVRVKDAQGEIIFEEVLKAGTRREVRGKAPFQVMIGNAGATSVLLDGQVLDLAPYTRPSGTAFIANLGG